MLITAASAAALLLASSPQTAPQTPPGADITSNLNSGPPRPAEYLAPPPAVDPAPAAADPSTATVRPAPTPAPTPPVASQPTPSRPAPTPHRPDSERFTIPETFEAPADMQPSRVVPIPVEPSPRPRTAPITPPGSAIPASATTEPPASVPLETLRPTSPPAATAPVAEAPPPPPAVPAVTVLDAAARAALPFSVELPVGFELVTGRPGPDFKIYTIRRGDRSFAMIYAGPASQFPIYSGEVLEAAGRASVVSTEDGVRHAREHLFQREGATPREIHVWTMSLDGPDRALAERIAQSVDVR